MTLEVFFFENHAEDEIGTLVLDLILFFFKKLYVKVKAHGLHLSFNFNDSAIF